MRHQIFSPHTFASAPDLDMPPLVRALLAAVSRILGRAFLGQASLALELHCASIYSVPLPRVAASGREEERLGLGWTTPPPPCPRPPPR